MNPQSLLPCSIVSLVYTFPTYFFLVSFNIVFQSLPQSSKWSFSCKFSSQNFI